MKTIFYLAFFTLFNIQAPLNALSIDSLNVHKPESMIEKIDSLKVEIAVLKKATFDLQQLTNEKQRTPIDIFIGKWIPILSFFIALISIAFGLRAIRHSRNMKIYQLLNDLMNRYEKEEMLNSIHGLIDWKKSFVGKEENFAEEFANLRMNNYSEVKQLDVQRRRVAFYFNRIFRLWDNKLITKKDIFSLISIGQLEIYLEYIIPLEKAMSPNNDKSVANFYVGLSKELQDFNSKEK